MTTLQELVELADSFREINASEPCMIATAESCTGGLISSLITEISGSSQWFDRAFVTYTNEAKMQMLQVKAETLAKYGAVSADTALEMVYGVIANSNAKIAVAVTGIAGPTGGTEEKPVGTVCIAFMKRGGKPFVKRHLFIGDRTGVRYETAKEALEGLKTLSKSSLYISSEAELASLNFIGYRF